MKFKLMQSVYIAFDTLGYDLPIGEQAFILYVDYSVRTGTPYYVRVPAKKMNYWMPECDLVDSEEYLEKGINELIHNSIVNYALDTKNERLFKETRKDA